MSDAWEGRGCPYQPGGAFRELGTPSLGNPNSWMEAMSKWESSGCLGQSPLGTVISLGFLPGSLGNQSHIVSHTSLPDGPTESPVFRAPLSKCQPQGLLVCSPRHLCTPRTSSLLNPGLECCSLWRPGSAHQSLLEAAQGKSWPQACICDSVFF